jgi:hypothetical protein
VVGRVGFAHGLSTYIGIRSCPLESNFGGMNSSFRTTIAKYTSDFEENSCNFSN